MSGNINGRNPEIRMRHLPLQNLVDLVAGQGRMEGYSLGGTVEWREGRNPLDVIPVKVGHKKMDG